ncbi:MAG: SDR family NAD(P)-dependent oxidoreductase [Bacteroidota bacterium]
MNTALITGASSGIGMELATIHASRGGDLVLVARSKERLDKMKADLEQQFKIRVHVIAADLSRPGAAKEVHDQTSAMGITVDILVNNAGFGVFGAFQETDPERTGEMIRLNITALTELTWFYLREMVSRNSGRIMNVASTAGFQPGPWFAAYSATKAYVISFTQAIESELRSTTATTAIRVITYCPAATETNFSAAAAMEHSALFKGRKNPDAATVALDAYEALMKGESLAIHGLMNRIMVFSQRFVPRSFVTAMANSEIRARN